MLKLIIKTDREESYDEATNRFVYGDEVIIATVDLEHSLASLSKWESIHKIPFLSTPDLPPEQLFDYVRCMVVDEDVDPDILYQCSQTNLNEIQAYISSTESATTFGRLPEPRGPSREKVTSELIYYWMITYKIPFEADRWHLNRLLSLIKIYSVKNAKPVKRSASQMAAERARINAERKAQFQTSG
jgi:hypothetical protein